MLEFRQRISTGVDEERYQEWLQHHPSGLVLSLNRSREGEFTLHRATCQTISFDRALKRDNSTGRTGKICFDNWSEFDGWVRSEWDQSYVPNYCSRCWKDSDEEPESRRNWAFGWSPRQYHVEDLTRGGEFVSTVSRGDVRAGDQVAVWLFKDKQGRRGVGALGVVLTDPAEFEEPKQFADNWIDQSRSGVARRVWIRCVPSPNCPLWVDDDPTGFLASLSVARATGGSVFQLSHAQWHLLVGLAGSPSAEPTEPPELLESPEGRQIMKLHKVRERCPRLVEERKKQELRRSGTLQCEVCNFDFSAVYGELGIGFIECHHEDPLSGRDGSTVTRLDDLRLVCSNCHRMLHRQTPPLTTAVLKELMQSQ
jgi:hypothetical protein